MSDALSPAQLLGQPMALTDACVLKSRLAKSAMSEALAERDAAPNVLHERLYGQWADGGIALCITGNVMIDRRALGEPGNVVVQHLSNQAGRIPSSSKFGHIRL